MRTAIVDHGNPSAWPGPTVACANGAEGFDWLLGALDLHELRIWRATALNPYPPNASGIRPKADSLIVDEAENQNLAGESEVEAKAETPRGLADAETTW